MKPSVVVFALGGTIAMTESAGGGVAPALSGEALIAAVPELANVSDLTSVSFRQIPSAHLRYDDLEELATAIRDAGDAYRGVVITQGTDTIEETAFALDCLLDVEMPVVVTGAMRNPTMPGADGPANLLASVQTAASSEARGLGTLVVFNDEIHAARFVRKAHTTSTAAFRSLNAGPIGWVAEGSPCIVTVPSFRNPLNLSGTTTEARVAHVSIGLGDDADLLLRLSDAPYQGLVVDATGAGHVSPEVADALERFATRIPVVLASRTGAGPTLSRTYGFVGSEIDLLRRGLIRSGWLDGVKSRVLLTLLLRHGVNQLDAINDAFQTWGGGRQTSE